MLDTRISGVEFIAVNTDVQALNNNKASTKLQIGSQSTKGLGAGGRPDIAKVATGYPKKDWMLANTIGAAGVMLPGGTPMMRSGGMCVSIFHNFTRREPG